MFYLNTYRNMMVVKAFFLGIITLCSTAVYSVVPATDKITIYYPFNVEDKYYQKWQEYFHEILFLAVEKSNVNVKLQQVNIPTLPHTRSVNLIKSSHYDVDWITTNPSRENELRPIKIPLYKGMLGWRLFFIDKAKQSIFSELNTIEDLKKLIGGVGTDWPDTKIMEDNGLPIYKTNTYSSLLNMLNKNRIDYFSRSIPEIWQEARLNESPSISVEESIALQYPLAIYFFVRKSNDIAYNIINTGLNVAIKDGSFDKVFCRYFSKEIKKSNLKYRKIFNIHNPDIPTDANKHLWFDPLSDPIC